MTGWKVVAASVRGTSHLNSGAPCQDSCSTDVITGVDGSIHLVCLVADGAGSASCGHEGAELACLVAMDAIRTAVTLNEGLPLTTYHAELIATKVQQALMALADSNELPAREFACTLLGAVISENAALFFQVGDGAIVPANGDVQGIAFWPEEGGYANATYFVTEPDVLSHLQAVNVAVRLDEVALMSDGLQRLALAFDTKTPHGPFFEPMFAALRQQPPEDGDLLQGPLMKFLDSPAVNSRTDDDKTLVLATRR